MREANCFDKVRVDAELSRQPLAFVLKELANGPSYLGDFQRMRQPGSVEVVFSREKNLRFRLQSSEGGRMNDPVAVDLERRAIVRGSFFGQTLHVEFIVKCIFHSSADCDV